jgi:hypothetical protein
MLSKEDGFMKLNEKLHQELVAAVGLAREIEIQLESEEQAN